jgi:hypothetical protein
MKCIAKRLIGAWHPAQCLADAIKIVMARAYKALHSIGTDRDSTLLSAHAVRLLAARSAARDDEWQRAKEGGSWNVP